MLHGKIVAITGASSGIGAVMARMLADKGAVPLLMARSLEKLTQISGTIAGNHRIYKLDVTDANMVVTVMEQARAEFGRIDVLINNAGYAVFERFADAPLSHFQDMMDVNYMGMVRCTKAVLPHMTELGHGHIVNIASMAGKVGSPKSTAYSASKHAVLGFTNSLRQELRHTGIMVSAINPGPIDTPFFDRADPSGNYVNNIRWMLLQPEQVASKAVRLIERRKAELDLPFVAAAGTKLYQLFPRLFDAVASKLLNKK